MKRVKSKSQLTYVGCAAIGTPGAAFHYAPLAIEIDGCISECLVPETVYTFHDNRSLRIFAVLGSQHHMLDVAIGVSPNIARHERRIYANVMFPGLFQ